MWVTAFIFFSQLFYVAMLTVRWIFVVRGYTYIAAVIAFFEMIIFAYALIMVVRYLDNPLNVVAYGLGFAVGLLVGTWVEGKIALGNAAVQVITRAESQLPSILREKGFGVTTWEGMGRDAQRQIMIVVVRRRLLGTLWDTISQWEPDAVVFQVDPRMIRRGFFPRKIPS